MTFAAYALVIACSLIASNTGPDRIYRTTGAALPAAAVPLTASPPQDAATSQPGRTPGQDPQSAPVLPAREDVQFRNGDVVLYGTLTLPPERGPHPALVFVSGSGPQNRDGTMKAIPGYRPFPILAGIANRAGFVVLRYDDRGVGQSTGDYLSATEQDFISDARAAIAFLRARSDVESDRIGVLGQSEGAMIAAILAASDSRIAFVASLGGPAVRGYELLLRQAEREGLAAGMQKSDIAQLVLEQKRLFDLALAKKWDQLEAAIREVTLRRLRGLPEAQRSRVGDPAKFVEQRTASSLRVFQSERYQYILRHDTSEDWANVKVPVLALFGELDVQCDATQNKQALEAAAVRAGNKHVTTIVIPQANHLFVEARTGSISEYAGLDKNQLAQGVEEAFANWLRSLQVSGSDHPAKPRSDEPGG